MHHYTFTVFSTILIQRYFFIIFYPLQVFFNNCCLTNLSLIKSETKHFEQVARCLNQWKNMNGFGNDCLITLPGETFLCLRQHIVSLIFQTAITSG